MFRNLQTKERFNSIWENLNSYKKLYCYWEMYRTGWRAFGLLCKNHEKLVCLYSSWGILYKSRKAVDNLRNFVEAWECCTDLKKICISQEEVVQHLRILYCPDKNSTAFGESFLGQENYSSKRMLRNLQNKWRLNSIRVNLYRSLKVVCPLRN